MERSLEDDLLIPGHKMRYKTEEGQVFYFKLVSERDGDKYSVTLLDADERPIGISAEIKEKSRSVVVHAVTAMIRKHQNKEELIRNSHNHDQHRS